MVEPPDSIRTRWTAPDRDVEALWALELEPERMAIGKLIWHLDTPLWAFDDKPWQLTPRQVLRQPFRHERHYRRIRAAKLMFPLEITRYRGRWLILDGLHRLAKAHEDGHDEVMVRKVPPALLQLPD